MCRKDDRDIIPRGTRGRKLNRYPSHRRDNNQTQLLDEWAIITWRPKSGLAGPAAYYWWSAVEFKAATRIGTIFICGRHFPSSKRLLVRGLNSGLWFSIPRLCIFVGQQWKYTVSVIDNEKTLPQPCNASPSLNEGWRLPRGLYRNKEPLSRPLCPRSNQKFSDRIFEGTINHLTVRLSC